MGSPEGGDTGTFEESFLERVLERAPALPVDPCRILDYVDLDKTQKPSTNAPGYAWEGVREWIVDLRRTFKDTEGPVVGLELCSSTPLATGHSQAREFDRAGLRARDIERDLLSDWGVRQLKENQQLQESDGVSDLLAVSKALARSALGRSLVVATIQKALYDLTPAQSTQVSLLREALGTSLPLQQYVYKKEKVPGDMESAWGLRITAQESAQMYLQVISGLGVPTAAAKEARHMLQIDSKNNALQDSEKNALRHAARETNPAGEELAQRYIDWQAETVATIVAENPQFRPARYLSMDIAAPDDILRSSLANTPLSTQQMHMFSHALASLNNPYQHIVGDILRPLPFPDNSLTFITCFDGWPFHLYTEGTSAELERFTKEAVSTLAHFYKKLAYGGQLVIFPWALADAKPEKKQALDQVVGRLARLLHHGVDVRTFNIQTIVDWMTKGDRAVSADMSSIFRDEADTYQALTITKPHESLVQVHRRAIKAASALISQAQNQG